MERINASVTPSHLNGFSLGRKGSSAVWSCGATSRRSGVMEVSEEYTSSSHILRAYSRKTVRSVFVEVLLKDLQNEWSRTGKMKAVN